MNKTTILLLIIFSIIKTFAVDAYPYQIEFKQPDKSIVSLFLKGDEHISWAETTDGYSLLYNKEGYMVYATKNLAGSMQPSLFIATQIENRNAEVIAFLSTTEKHLQFSETQVQILMQIIGIVESENSLQKGFPTTGNQKLICILMGFPDAPYTLTNPKEAFSNLFNQLGYSANNAVGSVKDFFLETSYQQLHLTVDIVGPFVTPQNMAFYGAPTETGNDSNRRQFAIDSFLAADDSVNYTEYDTDLDGFVDGVYILFAGYGQEAGANANAIWSHAWNLGNGEYFAIHDGIKIPSYSCSPELRGNAGSNITNIGVICHEFGHTLGARDFYDVDYATGGQYTGTGKWDLQANGSWNGTSSGNSPAHPNPYTKIYTYKWATVNILTTTQTVTVLPAIVNSNAFYRINTKTPNEFFLIENRQKTGFDNGLNGSGLLIYRGSSGVSHPINATHRQKFYPVSANANVSIPNSTPSSYGTINSSTCPWPTTSKTNFTDYSTPAMQSWSGINTEMSITNITRNEDEVSFDLTQGSTAVEDTDLLQIKIFPNPVTNLLNFEGEFEQIFIYDLAGKMVLAINDKRLTINEQHKSLDVSALAKGTYILEVFSFGKTHQVKLVKQ